jgi:hypothetical protein
MKPVPLGAAILLASIATFAIAAQNGDDGAKDKKIGSIQIRKTKNGKFHARIVGANEKDIAWVFPIAGSLSREQCLKAYDKFKDAIESHKSEELIEAQKNGAFAFKIADSEGNSLGLLLPAAYFTKDECYAALDKVKAILKTQRPGETIESK